jgi:hypothetical protein
MLLDLNDVSLALLSIKQNVDQRIRVIGCSQADNYRVWLYFGLVEHRSTILVALDEYKKLFL